MNYVDFLEESATSSSVPFMEFLRSQAPDTLHIFVEGVNDTAFYRHFVLRYFKKLDHIYVHPCGGKDAVYETRQSIISRRNQPEWTNEMFLLFFVDKDLSDVLEENREIASDIFVTDFYSVENYVVSESMLVIVLSDMFTFPSNSRLTLEDVREIKQIFHQQLSRFYELIKPIMVWGIHHKRKRTSFKFDKINLNFLFSNVNDIELERILPNNASTYIEALDHMCKVITTDYSSEVEMEIEFLLRSKEPKTYIRGKFEIWFFHAFMRQVAKMLSNRKNQKISLKDNLMKREDLMISLGTRVHPIPSSLAVFLSRNIREKRRSRVTKKTSD